MRLFQQQHRYPFKTQFRSIIKSFIVVVIMFVTFSLSFFSLALVFVISCSFVFMFAAFFFFRIVVLSRFFVFLLLFPLYYFLILLWFSAHFYPFFPPLTRLHPYHCPPPCPPPLPSSLARFSLPLPFHSQHEVRKGKVVLEKIVEKVLKRA